ncbi:STM3941 family protein [Rhizobium sp. 21-4511-3d]
MKVHRSPAKMIGLAFLSLLMTALALFVGFTGYQKEGAGGFPVFIGIIGGLFFLLAFIAIAWKAFDRRPVLDFSDEGLLATEVAPQRIAWRDLLAVRVFQLHKQRFIELQVTPQASAALTLSRMVRLNNRALGKSNEYLTLSTSGLDRSVEEIFSLIQQRAEAARQS